MKTLLNFFIMTSTVFGPLAGARAQVTAWQQSSHWTLYNVGGAKFYRVPSDSLDNYNHRPLNDDSMHEFLAQSSVLVSDKPPMWMGAFVASCIIDNKRVKVDISSYAGFFFNENDKKYYSIAQDVQRDWLNYFANCSSAIPYKKQQQ